MELTADEKDMLALTARNPDKAAWWEHYRHLKLPSHDTTDAVISRRIRLLRERPDASLFLEQQELELERNRVDAMKAADGAGWKVEEARQELAEETYRLAIAAVKHERERIADGRASSPQHNAKLVEVTERLSSRSADGRGMSAEERKAEAKRLGIVAGESIVVPISTTPTQPRKPEAKA